MPSSKNYIRNYRQEYLSQHASPEAKKKRASRNAARAKLMAEGKVRKGDGKDVAHKDNNPLNNSSKNLKVQAASKNRSYARTKNAGMKNK